MLAATLAATVGPITGCSRPVGPTASPSSESSPTPRPVPAIADGDVVPSPHAARPFRPSQHGFGFVNSFQGSPLPPSLRPMQALLGSSVPSRFGLCGGMSYAAADYFIAGTPIPPDTAPPGEADPLYTSIYRRQVDSYGGIALPARVAQCMSTPDAGPQGLQAMSARELPAILARLDAGELVPLCLIFVAADGKSRPWDNHQVLAYAHASDRDAPVILRIYDPNYPGDDAVELRCKPTPDGYACDRVAHTRHADGWRERRTRVRGLFATAYVPQQPWTRR